MSDYIAGQTQCRACGDAFLTISTRTRRWRKHEGRCDECGRKALELPMMWPLPEGCTDVIWQCEWDRFQAAQKKGRMN